MPKPCSLELRERVVDAVESGASRREAADWFEVSRSSAIKWMQRRQATGSIAPKPSGGSISPLEAHAAFLFTLIARQPDLTLDEIVAAMHKRRIAGSRSAVWRFLQRHKISVKKSLRAAEQERADVARARRRWMREQGMFDPARLVFLDETATSTNMVRLRGRCPRGQRLIAHVPHGHWKTITFVAGLRRRAVVAPLVLDGPMNATIFVTYLKECLAPKLKRGDVVIMDNLPVHRVPQYNDYGRQISNPIDADQAHGSVRRGKGHVLRPAVDVRHGAPACASDQRWGRAGVGDPQLRAGPGQEHLEPRARRHRALPRVAAANDRGFQRQSGRTGEASHRGAACPALAGSQPGLRSWLRGEAAGPLPTCAGRSNPSFPRLRRHRSSPSPSCRSSTTSTSLRSSTT